MYHPTEDIVITASHDATIRIWDVPTSQTLKLMRIHEGPVTGLSLHATGDYILSTSTDQVSKVGIWIDKVPHFLYGRLDRVLYFPYRKQNPLSLIVIIDGSFHLWFAIYPHMIWVSYCWWRHINLAYHTWGEKPPSSVQCVAVRKKQLITTCVCANLSNKYVHHRACIFHYILSVVAIVPTKWKPNHSKSGLISPDL